MEEQSMTDRPLMVYTLTHPWIQEVVAEVAPPEFDVVFVELDDAAAVAEVFPRADALVCLTLTGEQAALLTNCKLVMHNGVGYDGIARAVLAGMDIPLAITPAMTPEGVAEHVFLMMLALSRQLPAMQTSMRAGGWDMLGWRQGSHNLAGRTLGIVGVGRIGRRVAAVGQAFGMQVLGNDIVPFAADLAQAVTFDHLVATADLITVHVPLTDQTHKMFGAAQFGAMKPGTLFVNASRGPTYQLDALHASVASGHLGGAAIDVFDPEPPPADHPILQMANVICTPHIASGTVERQYAINRAQFANAQRVLAGDDPENEVPAD